MPHRIHILGASGSGTTTLGKALAEQLACPHFDTDGYYWLPTDPPFQTKREIGERQRLLLDDLEHHDEWVLSGSLCGWGDVAIPHFTTVVSLWIPPEIRLERLRHREKQRYGAAIEPGGSMNDAYQRFIEWAAGYDEGDLSMRSRQLHETWIAALPCPVVRIETDLSVTEKMRLLLSQIG